MSARIQMQDVESSQIHSIGHDPETNTLAVRFWRGYGENKKPAALYEYDNFTADDFELFKNAESLGRHFKEHIRHDVDKYPYRLIDLAPAAQAA
ncbi:hypothetical protein ARC20_03360 [Stenotrophomonas panacihumi]|uniref:KTSC domain-containing protein n=1 Tax=Stenotrophomonas panacihumi TaxID=676599 RepID=A0A0R0B378_9GAMM|nr:KTSC domain-containing protein [Stenotrophomonas panacihumi]KRG47379.1 hypothetical protein ARC20_03360 [Stenotrophomonas panacihumi]PTN55857.1 KTSC domain-containing protein [Stenotrophomonas panacihumi]